MQDVLRVEVVDTEECFNELGPEWRDLVCQCPDAPYYLSWEFVWNRWKYFAAGRELRILAVRDDHGRLVGIAPFAIARTSVGPLSLRRLEFVCRVEIPFRYERFFLDGERLDVVAHPDRGGDVVAALLDYMEANRADWDIVDLGWLSPRSHVAEPLVQSLPRAVKETAVCAVASLPGDRATYEEKVLGKSESKRLRRFARRLERDHPGQAEFELVTDRDRVGPAIARLDELKARRWLDVGEAPPDEEDPHIQLHKQFDRDFALAAFDRGWLRLYQLWLGDEVIAVVHCIVFNGTDYLINKGFDPEWKQLSPGNVLQAHEIEQAINEGVSEYDFGHGWVDAKRMWSNGERHDLRLVASTTWRGVPYHALELGRTTARAQMRRIVRRLLPEERRTRLRRAITNRTRRTER